MTRYSTNFFVYHGYCYRIFGQVILKCDYVYISLIRSNELTNYVDKYSFKGFERSGTDYYRLLGITGKSLIYLAGWNQWRLDLTRPNQINFAWLSDCSLNTAIWYSLIICYLSISKTLCLENICTYINFSVLKYVFNHSEYRWPIWLV